MEGLCLKKNISSSSIVSHIKGALQQLCKELDKYQDTNVSEFLQISVEQDGIYLNAERIIDHKSKQQHAVFSILIEHYFHEVCNGISYLSSASIRKKLARVYNIDIDEQQLWIAISKIRSNANKICDPPIILSRKWAGYRLADDVMFRRLVRV